MELIATAIEHGFSNLAAAILIGLIINGILS